ncbi:hypothetical protein C5P36_27490, partial [Escherichia coli]|uniref:hypothetical protein n=1 Tax=Escherichia coli TaxID=562 RepID=UPI000D450477
MVQSFAAVVGNLLNVVVMTVAGAAIFRPKAESISGIADPFPIYSARNTVIFNVIVILIAKNSQQHRIFPSGDSCHILAT